jgi:hypothetical protein
LILSIEEAIMPPPAGAKKLPRHLDHEEKRCREP